MTRIARLEGLRRAGGREVAARVFSCGQPRALARRDGWRTSALISSRPPSVRGAPTIALALFAGCATPEPPPRSSACPDDAKRGHSLAVSALRGGTDQERFLALEPEQQTAVVALYAHLDYMPEAICTGVLVSLEHVLTARHCVDGPLRDGTRLSVRMGPDADAPEQIAEIAEIELHPSADLAVLVLTHALPDDARIAPIALRTDGLDDAVVGGHVAVTGYGLDDRLRAGTRAYGAARIEGLEAEHLRVTGLGRTGLCFGDSGGPLLARADDADVEVLGLLAKGSSACDGADRFTRLDRARDWLEARVADADHAPLLACDALGQAGRCFGAQAVRCDAGELVVEACSAPRICGWDEARGGHGCVSPDDDPCAGTAAIGRCAGSRAESCAGGAFTSADCAACGLRCQLSGSDGRAECVAPDD
jgi:hypothetical protein